MILGFLYVLSVILMIAGVLIARRMKV